MLNFYDFIQVYVFSTNHHFNRIKIARILRPQELEVLA